ncbi:T-cell receptor beta chain V region 3H.25, partial [Galemys pyrenaicus]
TRRAELSQTPRLLLIGSGHDPGVPTESAPQHPVLSWYRQDPGKGCGSSTSPQLRRTSERRPGQRLQGLSGGKGAVPSHAEAGPQQPKLPVLLLRILCCLALCLLGADSLDVEVTQTPGHLVKGREQKAYMSCTPAKGHAYVYWYQQVQGKELKFLIYFQNEDIMEQIDLVKKRFKAKCPKKSPCSLEIQSTEETDSALYFCASSQHTALKCHVAAEVTQSPRHLITEPTRRLVLQCSQNTGHDAMYWYRQDPGLGLRLIYYSINVGLTEKGDVSEGYKVSRKVKANFSLILESTSLNQTSLYLCASILTNANVTQTPRYLVKKVGDRVLMECSQNMDHDYMYWYRQHPEQGLQLLHYSITVRKTETGDFPEGYSVSREKKSQFPLTVESASHTHTSVYLCASILTNANVTQTPRYLVKKVGDRVLMECSQNMDHDYMYWYRQHPEQGLQLLHYSITVRKTETGDFPEGYSVSREKKSQFPLTVESASHTHTSVYLCASSLPTAGHTHILPAQKGPGQGRASGWG